MRKDLDCGIGDIIFARYAELRAYIVGPSRGLVSRQNYISVVAPLLSEVLNERCSFEIRLWNRDIKDTSPRRDVHGYSHIHTLFSYGTADQQHQWSK